LAKHDHGDFPERETRARLFTFFPLSPLIIHPCYAPPSKSNKNKQKRAVVSRIIVSNRRSDILVLASLKPTRIIILNIV